MDLPPELVYLVFERCNGLMAPVMRCVSSDWRVLADTSNWRKKPRSWSHEREAERHVCLTPRRCAVHYAKRAMDRGWWSVVEWMLPHAGPFDSINDLDAYACERAVIMDERGDLRRITLWTQRGTTWMRRCKAWKWAARRANTDALWWFVRESAGRRSRSTSDAALLRAAARGGHMGIVEQLLDRIDDKSRLGRVCGAAAKYGHLELLGWLHARGLFCGADLCCIAANAGYTEILRWARNHGHTLDGLAACAASAGGHLETLQWLTDQGVAYGAMEVAVDAAKNGHLHILRWLARNGTVQQFGTGVSAHACAGGHWDIVRWLRENGHPCSERMYFSIGQHGNLEMLQWARAHGLGWSETACEGAASGGHLEALQWARSNGCPWSERTCALAASGGHLDVLKWARSNGCPWGERTCTLAASEGHLDALKWAILNECPWDAGACRDRAVRNGHLAVLEWLHENGWVVWSAEMSARAAAHGHLYVVQWIIRTRLARSKAMCTSAIERQQVETVQWLKEEGSLWNWKMERLARNSECPELREWARSLSPYYWGRCINQ